MASIATVEDVRTLWLATLQRLLGRVSHDLKDYLNGVSVNLEVIRSRAAKPDALATAVAPFAEAAAQQLERLTTLLEAVLAVGRPERDPADVRMTLSRVAVLCCASSSSADASVDVHDEGVEDTLTSAHGDAVRLAIAAPLLEVVGGTDRSVRASPVRCTLRTDVTGIVVTMAADGRPVTMPDAIVDALRVAGIRWTKGEQQGMGDLSLVFPRA